uniref:MMS19 nucleotide excision repair protein n=3 Tax=Parascaris univalens TaxID=6257 RepID=A0A915BEJ6_PARUN
LVSLATRIEFRSLFGIAGRKRMMETDGLRDVDLVCVFTEKLLSRSISLKEFVQLLGPRLTSTDAEEREKADEVVVSVLCRLPNNFLEQREVELLLEFLLSRFDLPSMTAGAIVVGINQLVLSCSQLPTGCEKSIAQRIFIDGDVQQCSQKDRIALYEVLEYLIRERLEGLRSMGAEFVLGFVRSITGERDPRCLIIVFRLFCKVVQLFSMGPFIEDLFDVVACYYPIEFKPSSNDTSGITRELLVNACEECLLAHSSFAPFTYQLIAEKMGDSDLEEDVKLEICSFLVRACEAFPANALHQQLDDILAGLRMIALNPAANSSIMPQQILDAVKATIEKLSNGSERGSEAIDYICDEFLENSEPFVLQSEMGMSGRSLALLDLLTECHPKMSKTIIERVLLWLIMIVKGETVNSAANRDEVIDEGFRYLPRWCKLAVSTGNDSLLLFHQECLVEVTRMSGSKIGRYSLGEVFVSIRNENNSVKEFYDELLAQSFEDAANENVDLRNSCLSFIHSFALCNWNLFSKLLPSRIDPFRDDLKTIPILCAAVCSSESAQFVLQLLQPLLSTAKAWSAGNLQNVASMFTSNKSEQQMCQMLFYHIFDSLTLASDDTLLEHSSLLAECIQDIGLNFSARVHSDIIRFLADKIERRSILFLLVYLFVVQSENVDEMTDILGRLPDIGLESQKIVLIGAIFNKTDNVESKMKEFGVFYSKFSRASQLKYKGVICRQLLLIDKEQGWEIFESLLDEAERHPKDEALLSCALDEVVNLDSRWSDIVKCAYCSTVLARQRIFCQMLPVLLRRFSQLQKGDVSARSVYFRMLSPLLKLAEKIAVPLNHEYLKLSPMFCEALDANELSLTTVEMIVSGLEGLIKAALRDEIQADFIRKVLPKLQRFVTHGTSIRLILSALECLELMARRCDPLFLLSYFPDVVSSTVAASKSKKRKIRSKAASVRNLWELLTTK